MQRRIIPQGLGNSSLEERKKERSTTTRWIKSGREGRKERKAGEKNVGGEVRWG
jgi:hypothetical protein